MIAIVMVKSFLLATGCMPSEFSIKSNNDLKLTVDFNQQKSIAVKPFAVFCHFWIINGLPAGWPEEF